MPITSSRWLIWLAVACAAPAISGCGEADSAESSELLGADEDADVATTEDALTGSRPVGSTLKTTTALNLRSGASTGYGILTVMPQGASVTVVRSAPVNGWYNIKYGTRTGWASGKYLYVPGTSSGGSTGGATVRILGGPVVSHAQSFANSACSKYGCPYELGTREGHSPTRTRAIDFMMSRYGTVASGGEQTRGTNIANYAISAERTFKVTYAIWRQRINSADGRGWRFMENRGSNTQNHYDHVHVSFDP